MEKPTVISLFCGCGGSSLGYKMADFKELLAIDFNKNSVETFKLNFDCPVWLEDITKISGDKILKFCNIQPYELDILDASPPCQGFSFSGKRNINDSRNNLVINIKNLIDELKPKVFIIENVYALSEGKMKGKFIEIITFLKKTKYNIKCNVLNSANYGVAQNRKRIFFIGIRPDLKKEPIFPEHNKKIICAKDVLSDLKVLKKELKDAKITNKELINLYSLVKKGKSFKELTNGTKYFNIIKLDENKPSPTILKTRNIMHYNQCRYLTINEVKRLCSYPDNFKLIGSKTNQWARLGNSVMPLQMKAIANTIKNKILKG